ncbi:MAG TPA: hypothetical protein VMX55_12150 [candidate division Zixibacteria bacterium]|nr:hypothetical protein [candidate division Zixibacteria bacterium]
MEESQIEVIKLTLKGLLIMALFIGALLILFLPLTKGENSSTYEEIFFSGNYYRYYYFYEREEFGQLTVEDGYPEAIKLFTILACILLPIGCLTLFPSKRNERIKENIQRIMDRIIAITFFYSGILGSTAVLMFFNYKSNNYVIGQLTFATIFGLITYIIVFLTGLIKSVGKIKFQEEIKQEREKERRLIRIAEIIVYNYQMEEFEKKFLEKFREEIAIEKVHVVFREVLKIYLRTDLRTNDTKEIAKPFIYLANTKELEIIKDSVRNIVNPLRREKAQKLIDIIIQNLNHEKTMNLE